VKDEYDVIVAGSGPAGFAAAYYAAHNGADTLLVEKNGVLGGTLTTGLMGVF
jgi:flavin-dependent dehydrogenase